PSAAMSLPLAIMARVLIAVGAMRAEANDILQKSLIVRCTARVIEVVLEAEAAEFAGVELDHRAAASWRDPPAVDCAVGKSAGMSKDAVRAKSLVGGSSGGEGVAEKKLMAEFDELGGRCEPAQLDTVVVILGIQKRPIGQSLIGKVPGVRVLLVEIADPREEAA